jgi:asparagine synthase (glutamine-hydrolysing)
MCGIIGVFNDPESKDKVLSGLRILKNRGRDGFGICSSEEVSYSSDIDGLETSDAKDVLGHCLHSVVNVVKQPIIGKGRFVSNLEIYNWKALNEKYGLKAENDSDLLLKLLESRGVSNLLKILEEVRGVYAFAYWADDYVYLARDIIGVKPLWYSTSPCFAFASERKALTYSEDIVELNPREILRYNTKTGQIDIIKREFFTIIPEIEDNIHNRLQELLFDAISKRIPDKKFGLLFSGGIDSAFIAYILKKTGADFTCYTAALDENAKDLKAAKKVAEKLGLKLRYRVIGLERLEKYIEKIVPLIEDSNVVKVGVALPFYVACEMAREDRCKVIFSGLGSEELFGGYSRHKRSTDLNKDCYSDLLKMYERNTYRDDVITMNNNLELRVPFLDRDLVDFALKIPARYKTDGVKDKIILREIAEKLGMDSKIAWRKKRAAQYGSRFDWGIEKLAKKQGLKKSQYLKIFGTSNPKLGVLFSSGKDSTYSMHVMERQNYPIQCLISLISKNPESYMFHTPNVNLTKLQAEALDIPRIEQQTEGIKERELDELEEALRKAKEKYQIEGVVMGAIFSNYQRERTEKVCDRVGLKIFSPLWHIDQEMEMRQVVKEFEVMFSSVAAQGLDSSWLGRRITEEDVDRLAELNKKFGINVAGEGGEFESLVLDGPLFKKRIKIEEFEIIEEDGYTARMVVKKAGLVDK